MKYCKREEREKEEKEKERESKIIFTLRTIQRSI